MTLHIPYGGFSPAVRSMENDSTKTVLLIHSDTTDGSTTFTDSSASAHAILAVNTAQHDTAQHKWGGSSIYLNGSSYLQQYPTDALDSDFNLGTGAVTVDFWCRFESLKDHGFLLKGNSPGYYSLGYKHGSGLRFKAYDGSNTLEITKAWSPAAGTWYHVALVRGWAGDSNKFALCVNGQSIGEADSAMDLLNPSWYLRIGMSFDGATAFLTGWMDEFRLVKGRAMWTQNFITPAGAYR